MQGMLTKVELAVRLRSVNVKAVAALAGVSEKTVYRLRNVETNPTLDVVNRVMLAVETLAKSKRQKVARVEGG